MNRERQINDDRGITLRHPIEQCGQSLDAEIAGVEPAAACRQHVQSARMMADEGVEQMVVETVRSGDDLLELKFWRNVEIVAHMARLEIEIDKRDPGAFGRLVFHELHGGFDGEGGIAHASRARRERNHGRRFARGVISGRCADPSDNVENFVRQPGLGDPIGVSGLNELFIVAGGNVAADNDEKQVPRIAPDVVDQIVDVCALRRRRDQDDDRPFRAIDRLRVDVFNVAKRA